MLQVIPVNNANSLFTGKSYRPYPFKILQKLICFLRFKLCFDIHFLL